MSAPHARQGAPPPERSAGERQGNDSTGPRTNPVRPLHRRLSQRHGPGDNGRKLGDAGLLLPSMGRDRRRSGLEDAGIHRALASLFRQHASVRREGHSESVSQRSRSEGGDDGGRKFEGAKNGTPFLVDASASFECRVMHTLEVPDHIVFIGQVVDAVLRREQADVLTLRETGWRYNR